MGRYPSPLVKHELSRLDHAGGRDVALHSLKCCVQQLEPDSIAYFLRQIGIAHQHVPRPYVISLYEDVARVHRSLLVPYIPRVIEALVCALTDSGSSHRVHEACAKVVVGISIYCIEPDSGGSSYQAREVLRLLCQPLLCSLSSNFEPLATGSAVCIKALTQSRNWGYASVELLDQVFSGVANALRGKSSRTFANLQLACLLVSKGNRDVVHNYVLHFLNAGKDILQASSSSWTLRVGAAQLLNAVMRVIDGFGYRAEIQSVVELLEKYRLDSIRKVRLAVVEALKTAKRCCTHPSGVTSTDMLLAVARRPVQSWKSPRLFHIDRNSRSMSSSSLTKKQAGSEVVSFDFVVTETEKTCWPGKVTNVNKVGEPCGDLIQEWIKVHDGVPGLGTLDGIDEGLEYEQLEEALNKQYMSLKTAMSASQELASALKDLNGGSDGTTQPSADQNAKETEWSVRDNPIATKNENDKRNIPNDDVISLQTQVSVSYVLAKDTNHNFEPEGHCVAPVFPENDPVEERRIEPDGTNGKELHLEQVDEKVTGSTMSDPTTQEQEQAPGEGVNESRDTNTEEFRDTTELPNSRDTNELQMPLDTNELQKSLDTIELQNSRDANELQKSLDTNELQKSLDTNELQNSRDTNELQMALDTNELQKSRDTNELQKTLDTNKLQHSEDRELLEAKPEERVFDEAVFGHLQQHLEPDDVQQRDLDQLEQQEELASAKQHQNIRAEEDLCVEVIGREEQQQQEDRQQQHSFQVLGQQEEKVELQNRQDSFQDQERPPERLEAEEQQQENLKNTGNLELRRDDDLEQVIEVIKLQKQEEPSRIRTPTPESDKEWYGAEAEFSDTDLDSDYQSVVQDQSGTFFLREALWYWLARIFFHCVHHQREDIPRGNHHRVDVTSSDEEEDEDDSAMEHGWSGIQIVQCGVEIILGGSACALVTLPTLLAVLKCLEQSSDCCYYDGPLVPT